MTANPLFMPGPSGDLIEYSATDLRQLIDAIFTAGVISGGVVTQRAAGANRSVDVSAIVAVVDGTDVPATQGKYLGQQPLTNVPLATAPVTGQSRIDSIIAQVLDGDQNGNPGVNDFIVTVQPGTPATTGSQVAPTLPASCSLLANVLVGPTVTSIVNANITDMRVFASGGAAAPGTVLSRTIYAPSSDDTNALTSGGGALDTVNLTTFSFFVPPSGQIMAEMNGSLELVTTTSGAIIIAELGWLNHSGGAVVAPYSGAKTLEITAGSGVTVDRINHQSFISGLTPGAPLQLDLAGIESSSGTAVAQLTSGASGQYGPTIMTVTAA